MVASGNAQAGSVTDDRAGRFRRAERAFWDHYGPAPVERFIQVEAPAARLRVQELGSGRRSCSSTAPAGPAPTSPRWSASCGASGAWSSTGPAGGLSTPVGWSGAAYGRMTAALLRQTLDALGVDRATSSAPPSGACGRCGWPRPTPRGWTGSSCWARGR
jgi:hypothetical protein